MVKKNPKIKTKSPPHSKAGKESFASSSSLFSEWKRQFIHVALGVFLIVVLLVSSLEFFRLFLLVGLAFGVILATLSKHKYGELVRDILAHVQREKELFPGEGAFMYVLGIAIVAWIFTSGDVIIGAILALAFQDSFSTLLGKQFGKTKLFNGKTLEGAAGGFIACAIVLGIFFPPPIALIVALVATVVELLPFNDSLTIPLVSGLVLQGLLAGVFRPF